MQDLWWVSWFYIFLCCIIPWLAVDFMLSHWWTTFQFVHKKIWLTTFELIFSYDGHADENVRRGCTWIKRSSRRWKFNLTLDAFIVYIWATVVHSLFSKMHTKMHKVLRVLPRIWYAVCHTPTNRGNWVQLNFFKQELTKLYFLFN